jgi:hypothetical protein
MTRMMAPYHPGFAQFIAPCHSVLGITTIHYFDEHYPR